MTGIRWAWMVAAALTLGACGDSAVNKDFEQQMKDRDAANAGDPYVSLENQMPQRRWYDTGKGEQFIEQVKGASGTYRANYDGLLTKLDADKDIDHATVLYKQCRMAYTGAVAFQKDSGDDAAAAAPAREKALAALRDCRALAKKGGEDATAIVLARFASTGIVMIGTKVVGQDLDTGLKLWSEGEKGVSEDKPGFKFSLKSFQGY